MLSTANIRCNLLKFVLNKQTITPVKTRVAKLHYTVSDVQFYKPLSCTVIPDAAKCLDWQGIVMA